MMKIGIYDPYLDDVGGGEKYMMTIASCLSKDHEVSVFWNNKKDLDELVKRFSIDLSRIKLVPNIFSKDNSFLRRAFETKKYDFLIVLSDGGIPLSFAKKTYLHIQQPLKIESRFIISKFKTTKINAIFFNSEFTKSMVRDELNIPKTVIYPPIKLMPKDTKKENIILHVGRFRVKNVESVEDYKKQSFMISTFKEMVDEGLSGWRFVLAVSIKSEDKEQFEKLKEGARNYPIDFMINKNNDSLWEIYNKAKIYWHASGFGEDLEKHPEHAEHFGISTVEAMGAGAVPVVINAGGQTEIVEDGKSGFLWDSIKEFKEKTLKLTKDENIRIRMAENAKIRAKYFSEKNFCQRIKGLIDA